MKKIVLVDEKDKAIGWGDKVRAHLGKGFLHRAFTVFLLNNKNEVLIQQRSKNKMLWPLFWETSCSSHPGPGEDYVKVGQKRIKKELGLTCLLKLKTKFQYRASYKKVGSENEICGLLTGKCQGKVIPDKKEVADWKWIDKKELEKEIKARPQKYAPWLKIGLKKL